jgi:hypothetical protein
MPNKNTIYVSSDSSYNKLFTEIKGELLKLDPVSFVESYLKIDGDPFKMTGVGWRHMSEIYRYIALKAIHKDGKPVVIVKGRQVGATVMAGALDLYFTASGMFGVNGRSPIKVLHCFPQLSLAQRFSQSKLDSLINTATNDYINQQKIGYNPKTKKVSASKPDNMTFKQFKNSCELFVESIGNDGDRIRGMSIDVLLYDEIQDMSPTAIGVALKTLTQSKYGSPGVQVYFGTPKAKGSYFETALWNQSDKRYYFLGCTNKECNHYFMLSTPGSEDWQKIWLYDQVVKCPNCGHEDDKRVLVENGKWIATEPLDKDGSEKKFVGYHISQLYVPTLNKKYILQQKPENNPASSERIYYNEVLGEFYSGTDMPITKDEIYQKCRDPERKFRKIILPSERKTWMGVDWGGKVDTNNSSAGQSYSCVVVLSADSSGIISVEFAYKMKSTDFQHKMDFIRAMFKNYNLRLAVADFGYGHDICNELQKVYGDRFISCMASGNIKKNVIYDKELIQMKWNKDYYIEELYDLMRKGKIKFPWKSFEDIDWLIDHITSMEVDHTMIGGMPKKVYKKGPTPNDGFMALIHAYLAYKFELSKGFSINLNNPSQTSKALRLLAYLPKLR